MYTPLNSNNSGDIFVCISIFFPATGGDIFFRFFCGTVRSDLSVTLIQFSFYLLSSVLCQRSDIVVFWCWFISFVCEIFMYLADRCWDVGWNNRYSRERVSECWLTEESYCKELVCWGKKAKWPKSREISLQFMVAGCCVGGCFWDL